MATKLEFLVAKLKVVLALATVSVAISSPGLIFFDIRSFAFLPDHYSMIMLRPVPTIVIALTLCVSQDTLVSYQ